jgi:hypothetical protein
MEPGFHCECWNQRAVKALDAHTFTKGAETFETNVVSLPNGCWLRFLGEERSADGGINATRDYSNIRNLLRNTKYCVGPFVTKVYLV